MRNHSCHTSSVNLVRDRHARSLVVKGGTSRLEAVALALAGLAALGTWLTVWVAF